MESLSGKQPLPLNTGGPHGLFHHSNGVMFVRDGLELWLLTLSGYCVAFHAPGSSSTFFLSVAFSYKVVLLYTISPTFPLALDAHLLNSTLLMLCMLIDSRNGKILSDYSHLTNSIPPRYHMTQLDI